MKGSKKIEIEVEANIYQFFKNLSSLTGKPIKEFLEDASRTECRLLIDCWAPEICDAEELRERYNL